MTTLDDVRKTIEAQSGTSHRPRRRRWRRACLEPGAAKEQVAKLAADLLEWSQRSRERLRESSPEVSARWVVRAWPRRPTSTR